MTGRAIVALALLTCLVLIGVLGDGFNDALVERVQEQRLQSLVSELRARLETDLRIGLELPENERAQTMLEDAVTRTPMLDSIEIDSDGGKVLFSSDRALRDEPVPPSWVNAADSYPQGWRVAHRDEHSIGTPLHDAFGEIAGYLVWTHQDVRDDSVEWDLLVKVLWVAVGAAAVALVIGGVAEHLDRSRRMLELRELQSGDAADGGSEAIGDAVWVLAEARHDLTRVDRDAHRIAGIDS